MAEKDTVKKYWLGIGRRKTAIATVRLFDKDKTYEINGKKIDAIPLLDAAMELVGGKDRFGFSAKVSGGGKESQIEAIRLGLSRAMEKFDGEYRTTLKKAGCLSRDPREKERKKPGLKGARRAPQWAKR